MIISIKDIEETLVIELKAELPEDKEKIKKIITECCVGEDLESCPSDEIIQIKVLKSKFVVFSL